MALINTLRNKMGKIIVAVVAAAILSFTLNDILGSNSLFRGDNVVGKISGEKISIEEYQAAMDFQERNFTVYSNRQPNENDKYTINDRAWLWLMAQYAYGAQYRSLGLDVGADELWDLMQGENVDPTMRAFFSNQNGEFDRTLFEQFYTNRDNPQYANSRYIWDAIYPTLKPSRERIKFDNIMVKSTFVTQAEGNADYHAQSDVAEVKYLYIPFYEISDTTVAAKVTDASISEYYSKNSKRYKVDEQRGIKYVNFPIVASSEDTLEIKTEVEDLMKEMVNVDNDENFASANTDGTIPFGRYHSGTIPYRLSENLETYSKGDIVGPFREGGTYIVHKISDIYEDTLSYARASHILVTWTADTPEAKSEARTEANRILNDIKGGSTLASLAALNSKDYSTNRVGGDLGWIDDQTPRAPEEVVQSIFSAGSEGLMPNIVESEIGYHIVEVTGLPTNQMYAVSTIERIITPSDRTVDVAYRKADLFQSSVKSLSQFETMASEENLEILNESEIKAMDRTVAELGNRARGIVQWLFRDGEVGKVSEIFDINDQYIVAVMTEKTDEGVKSLEQVKETIRVELIADFKADYIIEKLSGLSGSIDEIASAFGDDASVHESNNLKFNTNSLTGVGDDPLAVGRIFSLKSGEISEPFATDNGVFVAEMINLTLSPEVADYSAFSDAIRVSRSNGTSQKISNLIEREANIEDKRYKVY